MNEKNRWSLALCAHALVRFAVGQAQQPTKVPRIGYLIATSPSVYSARIEASGRVCASLGTWRGKTLSLSGDMRRENSIASPRSRPS